MTGKGTDHDLMFFVGYLTEMRTPDHQIKCIIRDHRGVTLSDKQIRDLLKMFEIMFPAPVRAQLARYTLTMSEAFYHTVKRFWVPEWRSFVRTGTVYISRHYYGYTKQLQRRDKNQKIVLCDEMATALAMRYEYLRFKCCTIEGLLTMYLMQNDGPFFEVKFQTYLEEMIGTNRWVTDYKDYLYNVSEFDNPWMRKFVNDHLFKHVVDYLQWLLRSNPIDAMRSKEQKAA